MRYSNIIRPLALLTIPAMSLFYACQDKGWDDHYQNNEQWSEKTLMQLIEQTSGLEKFADILKANGYDSILNASQSYSVWAPSNEAIANYAQDSKTVTEFIENHISRFAYSTADLADTTGIKISMLNGKSNLFGVDGNKFTFAGNRISSPDMIANNGILFVIDDYAGFFPNLWEYITTGSGFEGIGSYLLSFDLKEFNPDKSVEIGTSPEGVVYDSVFYYSNLWITNFGSLNREDSTYTVILPTENAWQSTWQIAKDYFRTYGDQLTSSSSSSTYETESPRADSLQVAYTNQALTQNLVFRGAYAEGEIPSDSIISTNDVVFYEPARHFEGAELLEASNGMIYVKEEYPYEPTEGWHRRIVVEAETTKGRKYNYANFFTRTSVNPDFLSGISGSRYVELTPTGQSAYTQPTLILKVPNTLAAKYDIYCVTAPACDRDTLITDEITKLKFYMNYVDESGKLARHKTIDKDPVTNDIYQTSPTAMDTFLIAKDFVFPFANYSQSPFVEEELQDETTVEITVTTNVTAADYKNGYSRNLRVDCLILEPVKE